MAGARRDARLSQPKPAGRALCAGARANARGDWPRRRSRFAPARLFVGAEPRDPDFAAALGWARRAAEAGFGGWPGGARLHPDLRPGSVPRPRRGASLVRAIGRRRSPARRLGFALSLARRAKDEADRQEIAAHLRRAAEAGLPTALYLLGVLTERRRREPAAIRPRPSILPAGGGEGQPNGQVRWGLALMEGRGVEQDPSAGESWLRRAALGGRCRAAALVGDLYVKRRTAAAELCGGGDLVSPRRRSGTRTAARALGSLYLTGAGVARDPEEAARWFRVSAEAGDRSRAGRSRQSRAEWRRRAGGSVRTAPVVRASGRVRRSGRGVQLRHLPGQGVGVERDEQQAAQWLRRAAEAS